MSWDTVLNVLAVAVPIALPIVVPILLSWLKSQKVVRDLQAESLVDRAVSIGVSQAEAWARNRTRETGKKATPVEKLTKAVNAARLIRPGLSEDEAVSRIEHDLEVRRAAEGLLPPIGEGG